MSDIAKRLRASVNMDALNGEAFERNICRQQMLEAARALELSESVAAPDWHDKPTGPGLWVCMTDGDTRVRRFTQVPLNMNPGGYRYYGPIPEPRE